MRVNPFLAPSNILLFSGRKKNRGQHLAEVTLKDKRGRSVQGDIYGQRDSKMSPGEEVYDVYVKKNHVGHMELAHNAKGDLGRFPDYGRHMYIQWIGSGNRLKKGDEQSTERGDCPYVGVGTTLLQVAFERSLDKRMGGRIGLMSLSEARGFYLKNGFTGPDNRGPVRYITSNMALSPGGIKRWRKIVKKSPLLPETVKRFKRHKKAS